MTEGVLLRKAMSCDNLAEYKVVIIDEAHERTVNADLLMGFLKEMVTKRPHDLRVIIMMLIGYRAIQEIFQWTTNH